jgi:guanylate kinase
MFKKKNFIIIISSPSGCGKTTIVKSLLSADESLCMSVSATTRNPRKGEIEGKDYFFFRKDEFEMKIGEKYFLEYAEVFGKDRYYGTPKSFVEEKINSGFDVVFDIDYQGALQVKNNLPEDVVTIFILPPSMKELERRLRGRSSDSMSEIEIRLKESEKEIDNCHFYDYILVNDDLNESVKKIQAIISAERCKMSRQIGLDDFIKQNIYL